ncbi:hypothetical protein PIB30_025002 [Stylosanthes scabra]|uniref:Aluminum-activated malate transporter n=1 Tax=Stylosanthes scabra TaxID=79078 RepID=A0ABU6ZBH2_9FABA|nr:hypothetical protein [Stylosanthes scabra]
MLTIAIGCGLCLVMSLFVFPNWSGEYLHKSIISKLEGLANAIEVCVKEYFCESEIQSSEDDSCEDPIYLGYKAVLDSKASEETLALQASWEPRCSRYFRRIPWKQYTKVGLALRHFSYTVVALHGCLQSEIQTPWSIRSQYKEPCMKLTEQVCKILRELANSIRNKRKFCPHILSNDLNVALEELNNALKSQPQYSHGSKFGRTAKIQHEEEFRASFSSVNSNNNDSCEEESKEREKKVLRPQLSKTLSMITSFQFSEALPVAAFTSLLLEMVAKLDHVINEVEQLGRMSHFREFRVEDEIVVTCERPKVNTSYNDMNSYAED